MVAKGPLFWLVLLTGLVFKSATEEGEFGWTSFLSLAMVLGVDAGGETSLLFNAAGGDSLSCTFLEGRGILFSFV